jgi:hypothetical protein
MKRNKFSRFGPSHRKIWIRPCVKARVKEHDSKGPFGKAPAPASLAPDLDPREELILPILLENQNHF